MRLLSILPSTEALSRGGVTEPLCWEAGTWETFDPALYRLSLCIYLCLTGGCGLYEPLLLLL